MKLRALLVFFLLSLCPSVLAASKLTAEECRAIAKDFEKLSNLNPDKVEDEAPMVLLRLRDGESPTTYFIVYNIYIENLFNKGKVEKAQDEIEKMLDMAHEHDNAECNVVALRTQGQFYYKLGQYERAADCFAKAMDICPRYDSPQLENSFTWSSTLFWLVQSYIDIDHINEAEHWINQMDGMMKWLESQGNEDEVGYKPVMIRGLKAKIAIKRGDLEAAEKLLDECNQFIRDDIPSRAYVEYYVAQMQLYVAEGRHEEALPILDELIDVHINDYKPIAAEFLYQKGLSLAELGRFEESAAILMQYIDLQKQVTDVSIAQQIDEMNTRYEVQRLQYERDNMRKQLFIVLGICVALVLIVTLIIVNQRKLRRKNQILARNISELNRLARENIPSTGSNAATNDETEESNVEILEAGNKIVEFINQSKCYLRADCSRDTIKDGLGISERIIAKAITSATGLSFVNYINQLRLKVSIQMLEDKPEMTINDISSACGFGTVRQFQRIFKQQYDLTPSAYREARAASNSDTTQ